MCLGNDRTCHRRARSAGLEAKARRGQWESRQIREPSRGGVLDAGHSGVGVALDIYNEGLPPATPLCLGLHA